MAASIWYPGTSIPSGGTIARAVEPQTIAAGQTLVNFLTFEYVPGSGDLFIFIDGFYFVDFVQTSSTSITLNTSFTRAVELVAVAGIPINDGIGGDAVAFSAAGAGSVARTLQSKVRESGPISIIDKGAEIGTDASTALQRAVDSGDQIGIPTGSWSATTAPTFTGSRVFRSQPGALMSGTGFNDLGFVASPSGVEQAVHRNTTATDFASFYFRRQANHTGGTPGWVNSALRVDHFVTGAGITNYEWAFTSVMYNYATAGENVAAYLLGRKYAGAGGTWGAVIECFEEAPTNDPTTGSVALELDLDCNGTDNGAPYGARVGCDLAIRRSDPAGVAANASWGFRIQGDAGATVKRGFSFYPGITANLGFDTTLATISQAAFAMAEGQAIAFTAALDRKMFYDAIGVKITGAAGALLLRANDTGLIQLGNFSSAAATPASFVANRIIQIQQGDGTVLHVPAMLAGW